MVTKNKSVRITRFAGVRDNIGKKEEIQVTELFRQLALPIEAERKDVLPGWAPAEFKARRRKADVERVCFLVLDIDGGGTYEAGLGHWGKYLCCLHTSYNHRATEKDGKSCDPHDRFRAVIFLSRPVTPEEHAVLFSWAEEEAKASGLVLDTACKDPGRFWYMPSKRPDGEFRSDVLHGEPLDVDTVLNKYTKTIAPKTAKTKPIKAGAGETDREKAYAQKALAHEYDIVATAREGTRRNTLNKAAFKIGGFCGAGLLSKDEVIQLLTEAGQTAGLPKDEAYTTARNGVDDGSKQPRYVPTEDIRRPAASAAAPAKLSLVANNTNPESSPPPAQSPVKRLVDWIGKLRTSKDSIVASLMNIQLILENDPEYAGKWAFNEMKHAVELDGQEVTEVLVTRIRCYIEEKYRFAPKELDTYRAIEDLAQKRKYHPVMDYLESLPEWDRMDRISLVDTDILGAEAAPIHDVYLRKFMVGAIARVDKPGSKVDTMLILYGKQGKRKSTFIEHLSSPWFNDTKIDLGSKDGYMIIRSSWIHEWSELENLSVHSAERIKAFLSSKQDNFRPPYGKANVMVPRTSVMVGTTNKPTILSDGTGSRRFWIIETGAINIELLDSWRDQLWAQALHVYREGKRTGQDYLWWLSPEEEQSREEVAEQYEVPDIWEPDVLEWAYKQTEPFTTAQALVGGAGKAIKDAGKAEEMRVANILTKAGFTKPKHPITVNGRRCRVWNPKEPEPAAQAVEEADYP